ALRKAVDAGVPFFEAVRAVTSAPAAAVGLAGRAGVIEVGRTADLVVLTPDLELQAVLAGGSWVDGVAGR
ncbi:MAG: amidohydrolase family protein, partial [Acidimicrobiales bacterium]